jgi:hypothetical protein
VVVALAFWNSDIRTVCHDFSFAHAGLGLYYEGRQVLNVFVRLPVDGPSCVHAPQS